MCKAYKMQSLYFLNPLVNSYGYFWVGDMKSENKKSQYKYSTPPRKSWWILALQYSVTIAGLKLSLLGISLCGTEQKNALKNIKI